MENLWVEPKDFLASKGLLGDGKTDFIIKFEDGREVSLVELFEQYKQLVLKDCR